MKLKDKITGYHFMYLLSHFELPATLILHLDSLKKFCTLPVGALHYPTNISPPRAFFLSYLLTYGAVPFLRSCQLCSHSGNSQQLGEFLWTKYVRSIVCAVPACWWNQKSILEAYPDKCCFYMGICNHKKPCAESTIWFDTRCWL
jgi:hypothetical protein